MPFWIVAMLRLLSTRQTVDWLVPLEGGGAAYSVGRSGWPSLLRIAFRFWITLLSASVIGGVRTLAPSADDTVAASLRWSADARLCFLSSRCARARDSAVVAFAVRYR